MPAFRCDGEVINLTMSAEMEETFKQKFPTVITKAQRTIVNGHDVHFKYRAASKGIVRQLHLYLLDLMRTN